jgi:PleD family two-component response regulator
MAISPTCTRCHELILAKDEDGLVAQVQAHARSRREGSQAPGDGQPGPRVLVVDDEESITDLVATALPYEDLQVEIAASGRGALRSATSFRPHLIVLDVMLPDLDGFEVQRRLGR